MSSLPEDDRVDSRIGSDAAASRRRRISRVLAAAALVLALLVVLRTFVADVYRIESGSMRPTLFGGAEPDGSHAFTERVLVRYERAPELERFDLVVAEPVAGERPIVKRAVGLPGESVRLAGGDLLINGERLGLEAPRPAPIALFDDERLDVAECFTLANGGNGPWRREGSAWLLDARSVKPGSDGGMMFFRKDIRDGYFDQDGARVSGLRQANDAIVSCEVRFEEPGGVVRLQLGEEGDTFRATLATDPIRAGVAILQITRHNMMTLQASDPEQRIEGLASIEVVFDSTSWHRLWFANVDNHLALRVDGGSAFIHASYGANVPHGRLELGLVDRHIGENRVGLGGEGSRVRFRRIRIERDLFYTDAGDHGVKQEVSLGPGEYFLLGDHSSESVDSRTFGPVRSQDLLGRPTWAVWPLGRVRRLEAARPLLASDE